MLFNLLNESVNGNIQEISERYVLNLLKFSGYAYGKFY